MEIEIESEHSGDDISDADAECLFCTGLFLITSTAKNRLNV